ncbi:hypothetical protein ACFWXK_04695 [Streptomyces sp. NPDC059070]|uniref:hypothetical protein n=1 Tax=unclassified Streptomyces TaxID=2593676 RepID=UPI0034E2B9EB
MPTKKQTPRSPDPTPRGWRVDPIPSRPARRDTDGNVRVPLWLARDGEHVADADMVLLPSEAALLHDRLGEALRGAARDALHGRAAPMGPPWASAVPATAPPPRSPR